MPTSIWSVELREPRLASVATTADGTTWLSTAGWIRGVDDSASVSADAAPNVTASGFIPSQPRRLIGYDPSGRRLYCHRGLTLVGLLPDGALLVAYRTGVMRLDDPAVLAGRRKYFPNLSRLATCAGRIVIEENERISVLDEELACVSEFALPHPAPLWKIADNSLYWVRDGRIRACDWDGTVRDLAELPFDVIADAIRESGMAPVWTRVGEPPSQSSPTDAGSARDLTHWVISAHTADGLIFACNYVAPFTVVCFTLDGAYRWCRVLSPGCCGFRVQRLSCGTYVASSGCGGTVSWFDGDGRILAQAGTQCWLLPDLQIGTDDSVYMSGPDGRVLAFDKFGNPRWDAAEDIFGEPYFDAANERLVCVSSIAGRWRWWRSRVEVFELHPSSGKLQTETKKRSPPGSPAPPAFEDMRQDSPTLG